MKNSPSQKFSFRTLLWIIFGISLAALLFWVFRPQAVLVEMASAKQGPYQQSILEEGKTRVKESYQLISPVSGNLRRVELDPGDSVQAGDILAIVDWPHPREIKAPSSGKILRIHRESEGPIQRGDIILEIANPTTLEVVAEVLTEDAVSIPPHASVLIEDWGGCEVLRGKVRLVEPSAFTKISALGIEEQRVNVIMDFPLPAEQCGRLADAYRVYCRIITFETEQALTIPSGALFRDKKEWAVFKVVNGKAQRTQVKITRRNPEQAMIKSGLQKGDQVIIYPGDDVKDGARVKSMF